jgi:hypothetical protein
MLTHRNRQKVPELMDWIKPSSSLHSRIRNQGKEPADTTERFSQAKWRIWAKLAQQLREQA